MTGTHRRAGSPSLPLAAAAPAAVTVVVLLPELALLPDALEHAGWVRGLWLVVLLVAAPAAAWLVNRTRPTADRPSRALLTGLPQLLLLPAVVALDVRLDIIRGYLLAGTGEVQMAYGIGLTAALALGVALTLLVAVAGHLGARTAGAATTVPTTVQA